MSPLTTFTLSSDKNVNMTHPSDRRGGLGEAGDPISSGTDPGSTQRQHTVSDGVNAGRGGQGCWYMCGP